MVSSGKALIITEKPSVARDIVDALGGFETVDDGEYYESDDFICTYAVGHIFSLLAPEDIDEKYKRWNLDDLPIIPEKFEFKPLAKQKGRIRVITKLSKRKDIGSLVNACDAAREGELIFREIVQALDINKPIKRLWLQSMTKDAIRKGFAGLLDDSKVAGLSKAAFCRAYSDWIIGMNATRALTVRLKTRGDRKHSWSAGRVQTPTLSLLVDRELEILQHVPEPFFRVKASFDAVDHAYEGTWFDPKFKKDETHPHHREDRIFSEDQAKLIAEGCLNKSASATEKRKKRVRKAPFLFDLTSLQREANSRFGMSASRTLKAAQRCYEAHKVLTYPRTSSKVLPEDYRDVVNKLIGSFGKHGTYKPFAQFLKSNGLQNADKIFNDAGVTDHFAIIPTGESKDLDGDDFRIFDLVTRQFLAAFHPPAVYEDVERITRVGENHFKTKPTPILKEDGWMALFKKDSQTTEMPPLKDGAAISCQKTQVDSEKTKPPPRIGEASLLGLMENAGRQVEDEELASALQMAEGLGTAATRADIIESLKTREYVDKNLRPTVKGIRLIDILHRIQAAALTSAELTAKLELHLSEIEDNKRDEKTFLSEVAELIESVVTATKDFDFDEIYDSKTSLGPCLNCGRDVYEKAWFYGCSESTKRANADKECEYLIWKDYYGRYIDPTTVRTLLKDKITGELEGFRGPDGKTYKARLALDKDGLQRLPLEGEEAEALEVNEVPVAPCPIHENCKIVETEKDYQCETRVKTKKGFTMARVLCKRVMSREEVANFIQNKETPLITDFISKRGRPFSAKLILQETGRFGFEFPPRKPKEKKEGDSEGSSKKGTKKVTKKGGKKVAKKTTKKVTKKKTTKKKTTKKKTEES